MKLLAYFLCDSANVREGLLSVLSAGLTKVYREAFPASLESIEMPIMLAMETADLAEPIKIELALWSIAPDGSASKVSEQAAGFKVATIDEVVPEGLPTTISLVIQFMDGSPIPAAGMYEFRLAVADIEGSYRFWVGPRDASQAMPEAVIEQLTIK